MDRYIVDFIIDQSLNYGVGMQGFLKSIEHTAMRSMKKPDLTILIDIPPEIGYRRKRDGTPLAYLQQRRNCYLQLTPAKQTLHVDGSGSIDAIHTEIYHWVKNHITGSTT
jgi:thymidylate kinase